MDSSSLQNQTTFCSASPSWRNPDHPTAHDRFRHIFRDHWLTWCDLRLEVEVPPDQRAYVRKTVERMILCRDPSAGYARYVCPGCGFDRCVPFSCKTRFCPSCGKVKVDNWVNDIARDLFDQIDGILFNARDLGDGDWSRPSMPTTISSSRPPARVLMIMLTT